MMLNAAAVVMILIRDFSSKVLLLPNRLKRDASKTVQMYNRRHETVES